MQRFETIRVHPEEETETGTGLDTIVGLFISVHAEMNTDIDLGMDTDGDVSRTQTYIRIYIHTYVYTSIDTHIHTYIRMYLIYIYRATHMYNVRRQICWYRDMVCNLVVIDIELQI